ncbi:hypothetical protein VE03_08607 [Pseudogymnoascus sp. 23342-1-I1]|nr:hypothetical protein VE03_08607 [Pseudogymnoascus sp. 23342-1-I1]
MKLSVALALLFTALLAHASTIPAAELSFPLESRDTCSSPPGENACGGGRECGNGAGIDPKGQPEAFRQVAARLPLVLSILEKAKLEAKKLDEAAQEDLEKVVEACKEKAEKLSKIFKKVLPGDEDGRIDRYKKAVSAPFKGGRVEELMEGILRDAQLIATDKVMGIATEEQSKELADAIKEMKEIPSCLSDEIGSVSQMHNGSGHNIANTGPGSTNIQSGANSSQ